MIQSDEWSNGGENPMDVTLINPFINATINVLETMAFITVTAGKPYVKKANVAVGAVTGGGIRRPASLAAPGKGWRQAIWPSPH